MPAPDSFWSRAARCCAFGSAAAVLVSIAASQILLGLAIAALLISGEKIRVPRFWPALALFLAGTLASLAFSADPAAGLPQVRKFFVFLELVVVYSTLRRPPWLRALFFTWGALGALIAVRGFLQFAGKVQQAHALGRGFYEYYVSERITGFMSHWMTFSGQELFALLMICALLFFAPLPRRGVWAWGVCVVLIAAALVLGFTRSYWLAAAVAGGWLVWFWQRWFVAAIPVLLLAGWLASPSSVRERAESVVRPRQQIDSNQHRIVTWRTGLEIIRRHPALGLGPEGVKLHFQEYVPADIPRPLPAGFYGHLHNIYLQFAAERGIPVLLALVWMLLWILSDFWRGLRKLAPGRSGPRFLLQGGIAVVLATMLAGFFEHNLGDSEILAMFLVVVASGYVALDGFDAHRP
jgi:O-antigen ligase